MQSSGWPPSSSTNSTALIVPEKISTGSPASPASTRIAVPSAKQVGLRMLEGEVDAAALVGCDVQEAQLQRRQAALGLAQVHRQQQLLDDVGAPARDLDQRAWAL